MHHSRMPAPRLRVVACSATAVVPNVPKHLALSYVPVMMTHLPTMHARIHSVKGLQNGSTDTLKSKLSQLPGVSNVAIEDGNIVRVTADECDASTVATLMDSIRALVCLMCSAQPLNVPAGRTIPAISLCRTHVALAGPQRQLCRGGGGGRPSHRHGARLWRFGGPFPQARTAACP